MKHHYLKIMPEYYEAVLCGDKTFEVRFNDRDYQINDVLHLQEWSQDILNYTGRELVKVVSYILDNSDYCKEGFVILGLRDQFRCTKKLCPMQVGTVDNCNLTEKDCLYFTKER